MKKVHAADTVLPLQATQPSRCPLPPKKLHTFPGRRQKKLPYMHYAEHNEKRPATNTTSHRGNVYRLAKNKKRIFRKDISSDSCKIYFVDGFDFTLLIKRCNHISDNNIFSPQLAERGGR